MPFEPTTSDTPMWRLVVERRRQLGKRPSYRAIAADMKDNPLKLPPLSYGSLARVAAGKTHFDSRTLQLLAFTATGISTGRCPDGCPYDADGNWIEHDHVVAPKGTKIITTYQELDALDREWREMDEPTTGINRPFYIPPDWVGMPMADRDVVLAVGNQLMRRASERAPGRRDLGRRDSRQPRPGRPVSETPDDEHDGAEAC